MPVRAQKRKLIEVGLPLDDINRASEADKGRATGTLKNVHKWFAPMPLPAWRALLFAALVDDPGEEERRLYLLGVIRRLVKNGADLPDELDLREAQLILQAQFPEGVPTVMDPFCGGGSTLIEGQRLGLPTYGSDLNPVPVLISRTLTETLPKVWGEKALFGATPQSSRSKGHAHQGSRLEGQLFGGNASADRVSRGYEGLLSDVGAYAHRIRRHVQEDTSHLFPPTPGEIPIAWLWARTAVCPNPACRADTILATSWWLSRKPGDIAWILPKVNGTAIALEIEVGAPRGRAPREPKVGRGDFACLCCAGTLKAEYLRAEGKAGRLGVRLTAVAVERDGRRSYRTPRADEIAAAMDCSRPLGIGDYSLTGWARKNVPLYGLETWADQYTSRQLTVMAAFADEVAATYDRVIQDGGTHDYAHAVVSVLTLMVGRLSLGNSSQVRFLSTPAQSTIIQAFGRNDLPMMWDFAEANPFASGTGSWDAAQTNVARGLRFARPDALGQVVRQDARTAVCPAGALVATDPPYFDAIGYADLSDYFYIWHRRALAGVFPDLYTSMATPKAGELTAMASHHGGSSEAAKTYFVEGFTQAFRKLQLSMAAGLPCIIVYASKEQKDRGSEQTRWAAVLASMIEAGLEITGTWPLLGTLGKRLVGNDSNAVATYIVMVARPRAPESLPVSWTDFARELRSELPAAIHDLQVSAVLPVDIPQALMGPGMRIFSRYPVVLRGDGSAVTVDEAIAEINRVREEILDAAEGELDRESQCAVAFWLRHGWADAPFGDADEIVRPRGKTVQDLVRAQVLVANQGRARVLGQIESLNRVWDPTTDPLPTAWEGLHHLADRLAAAGFGVPGAAPLYAQLQQVGLADATRALAYRMAGLSAHLRRGTDEQRYNDVIEAWPLLVTALSEPISEGLF